MWAGRGVRFGRCEPRSLVGFDFGGVEARQCGGDLLMTIRLSNRLKEIEVKRCTGNVFRVRGVCRSEVLVTPITMLCIELLVALFQRALKQKY